MKLDIESISNESERRNRRETINSAMTDDINSGRDCASCVGHCCTFEHNSMQVTPLEALDAFQYLKEKGRVNEELVESLEECVKNFRLDKEMITQGPNTLRRYYTCPFYKREALGCSLDRDSKPYGCLAFNPKEKNVSEPGHCKSELSVLEAQNIKFGKTQDDLNRFLTSELNIYWKKMNLPNALLYLIKSFGDINKSLKK